LYLETLGSDRIKIAHNGDISFYEDTGTTAKFFWDASAESLGIGTSSPIYPLHVSGEAGIDLYNSSGGGNVLNFRSVLGDAQKYNMSISSYDHATNGTGSADGLSINGKDGVSIATGTDTTRTERMRIDSSGRVGIGCTPIRVLDIATTTGGTIIHLTDDVTGHTGTDGVDIQQEGTLFQILNREAGDIRFGTNSAEAMRIDSSQRVGIGTSSIDTRLHVKSSGGVGTSATFETDAPSSAINFKNTGSSTNAYLGSTGTSLYFATNNAERMRIDASGNVLVGKTTGAFATVGTKIQSNGQTEITSLNGRSLYLNRTSSDGLIAGFYKDSTAVGSIGSNGGQMYAGSSDVGMRFRYGSTDAIEPFNPSSGALRDNAIDLGVSTNRFKDVHLGGTAYLTNSSSISGTTASASSFNIASGHTGSGMGLYIGQFGVSANLGIGIDSNRIVTKPNQPAFMIGKNSESNIPINTTHVIGYNLERYDQGNNFTSSTFTAPVTGKYYLRASVRADAVDVSANYYSLAIVTSNREYAIINAPRYNSDPAYITFAVSATCDMDVGDTAFVQIIQSGGASQTDLDSSTNASYFCGYLLG